VPAHGIVWVPRLIATGLAQQRVGDHVGVGAKFSQHRVVGMRTPGTVSNGAGPSSFTSWELRRSTTVVTRCRGPAS